MDSLDRVAAEKLATLDRQLLRRVLAVSERSDEVVVARDGRRLVSFSCNDYLNLSHHPAVRAAAIAAIERYGLGAGASRLVTGNHPLYAELEAKLAQFKGTEAACVFGSGYLANAGIIPTLVGDGDLILIDALAHASMWAGTKLGSAVTMPFRHNDVDHLASLLAQSRARYQRVLILTEGVFSMDGDTAPLVALGELAERYDAWLMVDDAHGLGVLGGGRGSSFATDPPARVPLQMGTLSKAVGAYGAYLCASRPVIDLIKTRARTLIYSTGLPPAIVAAATTALDLIARQPEHAALPLAKARAFTRQAGLAEAQSPIVPIIVGDADTALKAGRMLDDEGFLVVPIRPPTVPVGTARLRVAFTAAHDDSDVARLAQLVRSRVIGNK